MLANPVFRVVVGAGVIMGLVGCQSNRREQGPVECGRMSIADAQRTLRKTERLYGHRIGLMAVPTVEGAAWRCLFSSPLAELYFQRLLRSPTRAGQAYALIGLQALESLRVTPDAMEFARDTVPVVVVRVMGIERYEFRRLVAEVRQGVWKDEFLREPIPYVPGSWALGGVVFDW